MMVHLMEPFAWMLTGVTGSCKQWNIWQESVTNHVVWLGDLSRILVGL